MITEATVLKLYPLGENSLIVVWSTQEGIVRTAAKGAKKNTSSFAGRIDLFYHCRIQVHQSKKGDLHTLTSVELLNPRPALRTEYIRLQVAAYFSKLFLSTLEADTPTPEFHFLLMRALNYLETTHPKTIAVLHFERELVRLHGLTHPGLPAHVILKSHFGTLPKQRESLLKALAE